MNSEKIVENHALPIRRVSRPSALYFQRAERWWHIAAISLPVDALILLLIPSGTIPISSVDLTDGFALLGILAIAGLFRDSTLRILEKLWSTRGKLADFRHRHGKTLIIVFTLLAAFEAILHFGQFGWIVIAAVAFVSYRAFGELSRLLRESRSREEQIDRDRLLLLEQRNLQVFYLVITPILAARLYVGIAAVAASQQPLTADRWLEYLTVFAIGLVSLLALRPELETFVTRCPRCARPGSRVLASLGGCPACARESFQVHREKPQPMSAERILASTPAGEPETPALSSRSSVARLMKRLLSGLAPRHRSLDKG